jgi:hypothetical protein
MIQKPVKTNRQITPATTIPIFPPSDRPLVPGVYVDVAVADGDVMFTAVEEKSEPWIEIVFPSTGCCSHAAFSAVTTLRG